MHCTYTHSFTAGNNSLDCFRVIELSESAFFIPWASDLVIEKVIWFLCVSAIVHFAAALRFLNHRYCNQPLVKCIHIRLQYTVCNRHSCMYGRDVLSLGGRRGKFNACVFVCARVRDRHCVMTEISPDTLQGTMLQYITARLEGCQEC